MKTTAGYMMIVQQIKKLADRIQNRRRSNENSSLTFPSYWALVPVKSTTDADLKTKTRNQYNNKI